MSASTPEPGWYADAVDPALIRWWDGSGWSEHTQPNPAAAPAAAPAVPAAPASAAAAAVPPIASAPYVPPPFADPVAETPRAAPLDYPPPAFSSPEFASPSANGAGAPSGGATGAGDAPGPRRGRGGSMPISEPVRLVPPASGAIPVAGFPGFDEPMPSAVPSTTPPPLAVPSAAGDTSAPPASGSFAIAPLATATPMPASASTPWTSSSTFAQPTSAVDLASVDYEPMTRTWGSARGAVAARPVTGVTTGGAWMLALSPWLQLGLAALGWALTGGGTSTNTPYVASGLGVAALLWIVIGVLTDYRRLGALGHEFRPSPVWILLGPFFYLMARAIHVFRTTRTGTAPTWVYLVSAIVVGAAVSAVSLVLPRDATLADLRAVETEIAADLREQGFNYTVLCPSEASGSLGASFVCTAYDEVGPVSLIRVAWAGLAGDFTYSIESTAAVGE